MANVKRSGKALELETTKPQGRDFWNPDDWDGTPRDPVSAGMTQVQYEVAHPLLYPPKK